ncbi:hypothetical protein LR48_Vigan02g139700 [Vigna angularis]|uniref:Uncharacterized protein n=1 Tax=Phaseolus angularis TaxID=3914 RepID=A0A0L9TXW9_PHAAN|nr:hypothetical protein LR48_Vigan02g139700 [Vigna angularis]
MGVLRRARENYFPFSLVRTHFFIFMDKPSVEVLSSRRQGEGTTLLLRLCSRSRIQPSLGLFVTRERLGEHHSSSPFVFLVVRFAGGSRDLFSLCSCSDSRRKGESFFPLLFGLDKGLQEGDTRSGAVEARPRRGVGFWVSFGIWVSYTRGRVFLVRFGFGFSPWLRGQRQPLRVVVGSGVVVVDCGVFGPVGQRCMFGLGWQILMETQNPPRIAPLVAAPHRSRRPLDLLCWGFSRFEWRQLVEIGEVRVLGFFPTAKSGKVSITDINMFYRAVAGYFPEYSTISTTNN